MLDVDIGEDGNVGRDALPEAQRLRGLSFDHALVGDGRTRMDVDADRVGVRRCGHRQPGGRVVAEHVDHGDRSITRELDGDAGEERNDVRWNPVGEERYVPEVLDDVAVEPCGEDRVSVVTRLERDVLERRPRVPRAPG